MSKRTLELLRATALLRPDNSVPDLSKIPQKHLSSTLNYYYRKRIETADAEISDLANAKLRNSGFLSTVSAGNAVFSLCPKLLLQESLVANDPLFDFAAPEHEMSKVEKQGLGIDLVEAVDLRRLENKLSYFAHLAPFIEAGFLYVLPIGLLHESPKNIPFNFPQNLYRERVPDGAVDFVKRSVIIRPIERTAEGLIILEEPNVLRKRHICITFADDDAATFSSFYHFREFEFHGPVSDDLVKFSYKPWSDESLDHAQYDIWIEQATNQTIGSRLESIGKEMRLADFIGTPYVTESPFEAELLALSGVERPGEAGEAVNFLEANRQLLNLNDPELVLRLRTESASLLERFQLATAATAEQLKGLQGSEFTLRAKQLFESDIQPQIAEVNEAIGKLEGAAGKGLLGAGAALVLGVLTGAALPVAAWLGLSAAGMGTEAFPAVGDYLRLRKQPQFIWHKLSK